MADLELCYGEGKIMTELRLGLPGGGVNTGNGSGNCHGKRGYEETVDLNLDVAAKDERNLHKNPLNRTNGHTIKPPAKAQVVGWPPVRSCRKNIEPVQKSRESEETEKDSAAAFVKVSMDGAPYLRKVDLKMYSTYQELSGAVGKMFSSFTMGKDDTQGIVDFLNESKLMDLLNSSEYVPTYEDKDGDWMLVGDVPWEMFVQSCKRLRIMKGTEAKGLVLQKLSISSLHQKSIASTWSHGEIQVQKLIEWTRFNHDLLV